MNKVLFLINWILILFVLSGTPNYWAFICNCLEFSVISICSVSKIIEGILMFSILTFYTKYSLKIILLLLFLIEIILSIIFCINFDISYTTVHLGEILGIVIGYISFYIIDKNTIKLFNINNGSIFIIINTLYILLVINGLYTIYISGLLSGIIFIVFSILLFIFTLIFYSKQ